MTSPARRCELCPTVDGFLPIATVRAWVVLSRLDDGTIVRALPLGLCESCRLEVEAHGDLVPGAEVEVL